MTVIVPVKWWMLHSYVYVPAVLKVVLNVPVTIVAEPGGTTGPVRKVTLCDAAPFHVHVIAAPALIVDEFGLNLKSHTETLALEPVQPPPPPPPPPLLVGLLLQLAIIATSPASRTILGRATGSSLLREASMKHRAA